VHISVALPPSRHIVDYAQIVEKAGAYGQQMISVMPPWWRAPTGAGKSASLAEARN
jgi:hypothetical protein